MNWLKIILLVAGNAFWLWQKIFGTAPEGYVYCARCGRLVADENVIWIDGNPYGPSCGRGR